MLPRVGKGKIMTPGDRIGPPRMLLVEDERAVRELGRLILEHDGWDVEEAGSLEEAQECLRSKSGSYDLFIVDLRLPDGLGTELAEEIHRASGRARLIFTTGDPGSQRRLENQGHAVLPKPYTPLQMIQAAREALAAARPLAVVVVPGAVQRRLSQSVLARLGMTVKTAASVDEGLSLAREPRVVLMLTVAPEGESAMAQLRNLRLANPALKVIALEAEPPVAQDWYDAVHGTPISEESLALAVQRVLRPRPQAATAGSERADTH